MIFPVSALPVLSHFLPPQRFSSLSHLLGTFLPLVFKSHPNTPLFRWGFPWLRQEEAVAQGTPFGTPFGTVTNTGRSGIRNPETQSFTSLPSAPSRDGEITFWAKPEQRSETGSTLTLLYLHYVSLPRRPKRTASTLHIFHNLSLKQVVNKRHYSWTEAEGDRTSGEVGQLPERESRKENLHRTLSERAIPMAETPQKGN